MSIFRKLFNGLTLRCLGAVSLGLAIVTAATLGLLALADSHDEGPAVHVAAYTMKFPEDEETLKEISAQILREEDTLPGQSLQQVEPAAGDRK